MLQKACVICKVVGVFAIAGALNWGLIGLFGFNLVEQIFGAGTALTRLVYILVGLSGLALLASFFMICPKCKSS